MYILHPAVLCYIPAPVAVRGWLIINPQISSDKAILERLPL